MAFRRESSLPTIVVSTNLGVLGALVLISALIVGASSSAASPLFDDDDGGSDVASDLSNTQVRQTSHDAMPQAYSINSACQRRGIAYTSIAIGSHTHNGFCPDKLLHLSQFAHPVRVNGQAPKEGEFRLGEFSVVTSLQPVDP